MRIATAARFGLSAFIAALAAGALSLPAAAQDHVWHHGLIKAKADAGIFLMVTSRDFAKKQGLTLKTSEFRNDQIALKALIAGEIDSYEGGPQGVFSADAKGADIRILGCHWIVVPHGIYAKGDIKTVADLKGKTDRGVVAQFHARHAGALRAGEIRRRPQ